MARTSGTYSPPNGSWSSGAVNGALATVADWQALLADISAALTQSVSKDGQTVLTGNLNTGGFVLTNLAAGTGTGQSLRFEQLFSQGVEADLASAATTDIGLQNTNFLRVTGTTTITSFGTNYNGPRFLRFAGAVTLTNSATLILPGAANITTAAGDTLIAIPKATAGTADGWQVVAYQKNVVPGTSIKSGTTVASTSGTSIDFTSIPSWVKRITVMFAGVSTSGTSPLQVQIGSGSITSSGYSSASGAVNFAGSVGGSTATTGLILNTGNAAFSSTGHMVITLMSGNLYVESHSFYNASTQAIFGGGNITLSGVLDRVRITTVNGTDTFDAGSINILFE
jgi:hypothetical protein